MKVGVYSKSFITFKEDGTKFIAEYPLTLGD